jgi:hypothetical protein
LRATDPDLWRSAGWDEGPNHYVNFGMPELGPYPFDGLPRAYDKAVEKSGVGTMRRIGLLPWRFEEMFGNLRRGFEGFARQREYAAIDIVLFSSAAAHYIQDAHQPFHASANFDGQLTGNDGIHARFESDLFERFQSRLTIEAAGPKPMTSPRDAAFTALLDSYTLVDPILEADNQAIAGKDLYDDDYYEKFAVKVKPILEKRLADAITATAGLIVGAWEAAGKPALELRQKAPLRKVRK